jgi:hypothetical protein
MVAMIEKWRVVLSNGTIHEMMAEFIDGRGSAEAWKPYDNTVIAEGDTTHDAVAKFAVTEWGGVAEILAPGQRPRAEIEAELAETRASIDSSLYALTQKSIVFQRLGIACGSEHKAAADAYDDARRIVREETGR